MAASAPAPEAPGPRHACFWTRPGARMPVLIRLLVWQWDPFWLWNKWIKLSIVFTIIKWENINEMFSHRPGTIPLRGAPMALFSILVGPIPKAIARFRWRPAPEVQHGEALCQEVLRRFHQDARFRVDGAGGIGG